MSDIKKIDKFTFSLKDTLGQGSFGTVYKGRDEINGEYVAIKMLNKQMIQADEYMLQGFFQEIKVMKKLKSQHVVQLLDVLETNNNYYIVQDFCDGGDLGKELKRKKKFSEKEALEVLKDLLSGFMELLQHGIIHRDLKPENILIRQGVYRLADFGFARTVQNFNNEMMKSLVGTPLYMSPQILKHEEYTTKSDIWSMALIYYEILFGKTPWMARTQYELVKNIESQPVSFPSEIAQISDLSKQFIKDCLRIEEGERITWDQIYSHPLFNGYFDKSMKQTVHLVDREKFIANTLRIRIISQKTDLDQIFSSIGFKPNSLLTKHEFQTLISNILNKPLSDEDSSFLFKKFSKDGNANQIRFEDFYQWMQDIECRMSVQQQQLQQAHQPALQQQQPQKFTSQQQIQIQQQQQPVQQNSPMIEQKAKETILKLIYAIQKFNVEIKKLYKKFDKSDEQKMDITNFGIMVKRIDKDLKEDEIKAAFDKFDSLNKGFITFQQFNDTLQVYSHHNQQPPHQPIQLVSHNSNGSSSNSSNTSTNASNNNSMNGGGHYSAQNGENNNLKLGDPPVVKQTYSNLSNGNDFGNKQVLQ